MMDLGFVWVLGTFAAAFLLGLAGGFGLPRHVRPWVIALWPLALVAAVLGAIAGIYYWGCVAEWSDDSERTR